ncbi:amidohydrolase family protein [Sphingoaurantiacus capsulatus]|uniref:Amidohydrolase family protein n=1 Tax=Sphingoaurantiacus capsulatus TaxID=1771310 RepID=A0ABV7X5W3_9SPHN
MFRTTLIAALLAAAPALADEPAPGANPFAGPPFAAPTLHFKGGQWFDGRGFRPMEWYAVDGKLTAKRPAQIDATIDLGTRHVIPPLAEAHNHDLQNGFYAGKMARNYMARGIFYSVQLAGLPADIATYRDFFGQPGTVDATFSEALLSASDGHPLKMILDGMAQAGETITPEGARDKYYWSIDSQADLDAKWAKIAAVKPKMIKVIIIDSANYAANRRNAELFGRNGIDPALVPEIVKRAHSIGARLMAHADTAADFEVAVKAGADAVAHLPGYRIAKFNKPADYRIGDAVIAEAAKRGIFVITTTAASRFGIARYPETEAAITANYQDNIRRLRAAGVKLAFGSDTFGGSVLDEIATVDKLKVMSRPELLRVATSDTPQLMFPGRRIGTFAEGAEASLLALDGDPLTDLDALKRIKVAVKQGELLGGR